MGFQATVAITPALGVAGDFASQNPRAAVVSPDGGFIAGSAGVTVGCFAWLSSDGVTVNSTGTGKPDGFVHREQQALINTFLATSGNTIPAGQPVTLMRNGDYRVTATVTGATLRQKAFAKLADGTVQAGAAGATIAGFVETDFVIARTCAVGELTTISL